MNRLCFAKILILVFATWSWSADPGIAVLLKQTGAGSFLFQTANGLMVQQPKAGQTAQIPFTMRSGDRDSLTLVLACGARIAMAPQSEIELQASADSVCQATIWLREGFITLTSAGAVPMVHSATWLIMPAPGSEMGIPFADSALVRCYRGNGKKLNQTTGHWSMACPQRK